MKGNILLFSITWIILSILFCVQYSKNYEREKSLIIDNERLRSFNARRERRLKWMSEPKEISLTNVALAFNILGTKPTVVAALLYAENGPEYVSSGSLDKSAAFARYFPIEQWSVLEGSRTLNRMAWNWILDDSKRAKSFFLYAAKPYTSLSVAEQKSWADNMLAAERRFRTEIIDAGGNMENPLIMAIRTPTAVPTSPIKLSKKKKRNIFVK